MTFNWAQYLLLRDVPSTALFLFISFYMFHGFISSCRLVYISHCLEYASSVIIFLNTNPLFFLMLSLQPVNPDAILWEFWFSGNCILGSYCTVWLRVPSSWAVSLVGFIWIKFAYGFLTICLMCAIFAVYLCRKSSADPLWDLHVDIYLDERKMA